MTNLGMRWCIQFTVAAATLLTVFGCGNSQPNGVESDAQTHQTAGSPLSPDEAPRPREKQFMSHVVSHPRDSRDIQPGENSINDVVTQQLQIRKQFDQETIAAFQQLSQPVESFEEWEAANEKFLALGEKSVALLAHKLSTGNNVERELAASTLVLVIPPPESAIPSLLDALKDTLPFVRANASAVLVQFPDHQAAAIPVLVKFLDDTDTNLQQMALVNLESLGAEAGPHVHELAKLLEKKDHDPEFLLPVVQLLGRIGPQAEIAVPKLKQIAFEQDGEIEAAANSAIQLIQTNVE